MATATEIQAEIKRTNALLARLIGLVSVLAVVIVCLGGLFALSLFVRF